MRKLINGVVEFRKKVLPSYRQTFAKLALGQRPDALFICCSDSRVAPNVFASTDPGDLFVVRNVGNMVAPCNDSGTSTGDVSESAALEFALQNLDVKNIIVCGHAECGAMHALLNNPPELEQLPHLKKWLSFGQSSITKLKAGKILDDHWPVHNQLSQLNVVQQIENLKTYPIVRRRLENGTLRIHGWWFDIAHADVYYLEPDLVQFVLLDEHQARKILASLPK